MSLWNSFTSAISTLGAVGKNITGGGAYLNEDEQRREEAFMNTVKAKLAEIDKITPSVAKEVTKKSADFLLRAATAFNDKIYSPYISRPISTVALLTDTDSALYKKGQYEEGFQFQDIKSAYNRSAKVSAMQALTKSDLIPLVGPLSQAVLSTGKINLEEVD
jgi:hypothetical protein